jgi:hypothetical protein
MMVNGKTFGTITTVPFFWIVKMVSYEGVVSFVNTVEDYYVVDADDIDDAEDKMCGLVRLSYPNARSIMVENIKEVVRN